jgi:hypothetical protein
MNKKRAITIWNCTVFCGSRVKRRQNSKKKRRSVKTFNYYQYKKATPQKKDEQE